MKLSHFLIVGALTAACAGLMSCGGSGKSVDTDADSLSIAELPTITVDRLWQTLLNMPVILLRLKVYAAICASTAASKAFLANPDTNGYSPAALCVWRPKQ